MITNLDLPIEDIAKLVMEQCTFDSGNLLTKGELKGEVLLFLQEKFDLIQKQITLLNRTKEINNINDFHLDGTKLELVLSNGITFEINIKDVLENLKVTKFLFKYCTCR